MPEEVHGVNPDPRFVQSPQRFIVGRNETFTFSTRDQIKGFWQRFAKEAQPFLAERTSYGVSYGFYGQSFQYLCGFDVSNDLPEEWDAVEIPASEYAIFTYTGHVSGIMAAFDALWSQLLPAARLTTSGGPVIEVYDDRFDGRAQSGVVEFWIPISRS